MRIFSVSNIMIKFNMLSKTLSFHATNHGNLIVSNEIR